MFKTLFEKSNLKKYTIKKNMVYLKKQKASKPNLSWNIYQQIYLSWVALTSRFKNSDDFEKKFLQTLKKVFKKSLRGNVLDLGGDCGSLNYFWQPKANESYLVHDPTVKQYENLPFQDKSVTFVEGVAEDLPYRKNSFDTILISDALDHFFNPTKALEGCFRVLKPNGRILILQSYRDSLFALINHLFHQSHLGKEEIKNCLQKAGFKNITLRPYRVSDSSVTIIATKAKKL